MRSFGCGFYIRWDQTGSTSGRVEKWQTGFLELPAWVIDCISRSPLGGGTEFSKPSQIHVTNLKCCFYSRLVTCICDYSKPNKLLRGPCYSFLSSHKRLKIYFLAMAGTLATLFIIHVLVCWLLLFFYIDQSWLRRILNLDCILIGLRWCILDGGFPWYLGWHS